jgi:hypothetical protein
VFGRGIRYSIRELCFPKKRVSHLKLLLILPITVTIWDRMSGKIGLLLEGKDGRGWYFNLSIHCRVGTRGKDPFVV